MKKGLILISSGADSPVAAHMARKRGLALDGLFFNQHHADPRSLEKVKKLAKQVGIGKLFVIDHTIMMNQITGNCNPKYNCVLCKRFMVRIVSKLAKERGYDFIVDGGNLGQVASQTLENIALTSKITEVPFIRPLLTNDKLETLDIAREIGTYDLSAAKESSCKYVPTFPATKTKESVLLYEEDKLDMNDIISRSITNLKEIEF